MVFRPGSLKNANGVAPFSPGLPSQGGYPGTIPPTGLNRNAVPSLHGLTIIVGFSLSPDGTTLWFGSFGRVFPG